MRYPPFEIKSSMSQIVDYNAFHPRECRLQMKSDDGLYINIHGAAVVDYPAMSLNYEPKNPRFRKLQLLTPKVGRMWKLLPALAYRNGNR